MKRVIWITSFFPPLINVAAARNAKLLKYLPMYGWESLVVCPSYNISPNPAGQALLTSLTASVRISPAGPDRFMSLIEQRSSRSLARCASYLLNNVIPPDGHLFWALSSLKHIERQIIRFKPDLIYTSCNPYSLNLIGAWAKIRFDLPWVTDFRDLWTLNQQPRRALESYHRAISGALERFYLRRCDHFIANTDSSKQRMIMKYPLLRDKSDVVPNGYDPQDRTGDPDDSFIPGAFLYSGSIIANTSYNPLGILNLLHSLEEDGHLPGKWQLHYAGGQGRAFKTYVARAGIKLPCIDHGYLDHKNYYQLIKKMDYVLLALPEGLDCSSWVPSRFYDYMANKVKIICLAPQQSEIFSILKKYRRGLALCYEDPKTIKLRKLSGYLKAPPDKLVISDTFIEQFSRQRQAQKISKIFSMVSR